MPEIFIHERENNSDTESFLNEKREDFESDAKYLLHLLYKGWRLNGRQVEMWGINSRRLRELAVSHKDIRKEWKLNQDGKREVMEYFFDVPKPPTKSELNQWFKNVYQEEKGEKRYVQQHLFKV